jgi:hypothetical protein
MEEITDMPKPTRVFVSVMAALLLCALLSGCGGDDEREDNEAQRPVDGTFVGKLSGEDALIAVVAAPEEKGKDTRAAMVYVSDGSRLSEWFPGTIERNSFTASSEDEDAEAKGELAGEAVKGSVKLPDGKSVDYEARRATGAAGLYELTVSRQGTLSGASAAGVGLTSKSRLAVPGNSSLKFADGKRRKFRLTTASGGENGRVRAGEVQLIVLPDGEMSGAGSRQTGAGEPDFYIKSAK